MSWNSYWVRRKMQCPLSYEIAWKPISIYGNNTKLSSQLSLRIYLNNSKSIFTKSTFIFCIQFGWPNSHANTKITFNLKACYQSNYLGTYWGENNGTSQLNELKRVWHTVDLSPWMHRPMYYLELVSLTWYFRVYIIKGMNDSP